MSTTRYAALIDGKRGAYGVTFPDLPGCTAMGRTLDEAFHCKREMT
jgi:predicted RNase H-like HicB family nuclease